MYKIYTSLFLYFSLYSFGAQADIFHCKAGSGFSEVYVDIVLPEYKNLFPVLVSRESAIDLVLNKKQVGKATEAFSSKKNAENNARINGWKG